MSNARAGWLVAMCAAAAACYTGPSASGFPPAVSPHGVDTRLWLGGGGETRGELLAVRDTAFVLLADQQVVLVPAIAVVRSVFRDADTDYRRGLPNEVQRQALRLLSRFPQGMSPPILSTLLRDTGQSELVVRR